MSCNLKIYITFSGDWLFWNCKHLSHEWKHKVATKVSTSNNFGESCFYSKMGAVCKIVYAIALWVDWLDLEIDAKDPIS